MRIGSGNRNITHTQSKLTEQKDKVEAKSVEKPRADSVVVTIGETAKNMVAGTSGTSTLDPKISARLEEVRQQLKNNSYAIDYSKLASSILGDEVSRSGGVE